MPAAVSTSRAHAEPLPPPKTAAPQLEMMINAGGIDKTDNVAVRETFPNRIRQRMRRPKDQLLKHRPPDIGDAKASRFRGRHDRIACLARRLGWLDSSRKSVSQSRCRGRGSTVEGEAFEGI